MSAPIQLPYPPGMVASSPDGRIFYTYHMLHKPERFSKATIFEWVDGKGVPFPNQEMQSEFHGAMGVNVDRQGRIWVIKPGALEGRPTRLMAIDMSSGELVLDHTFAEDEAGFAQDIRVSPDGKTVFLADTGLFNFTEANLIVFDVATKTTRTLLKGHPAVSPQDWLMRKTNGDPYRRAFGLLSFVVGIDGLALTEDGTWLYFAAMSHESVYRVPTAALLDASLTNDELGKVILTDVENGGLVALSPNGTLSTMTNDPAVDWADSVTVAPDGAIWFTDSRLTNLIDQFANPADQAITA